MTGEEYSAPLPSAGDKYHSSGWEVYNPKDKPTLVHIVAVIEDEKDTVIVYRYWRIHKNRWQYALLSSFDWWYAMDNGLWKKA